MDGTGTEGDVSLAVDEGVGTIEFSHPKGNSLPGALLRQLADGVQLLGEDEATRVIVLGSGGTGPFCAGASFDELVSIENEEEGQEFFSGFARVILAMIRAPKFVLVRVHGRAAGGGVGIAAAGGLHLRGEERVGEAERAVGGDRTVRRRAGDRAADRARALLGAGGRHRLARCRVVRATRPVRARARTTWTRWTRRSALLAGALRVSNPAAMAEMKRTFWQGTEDWDDPARRAGARERLARALRLHARGDRAIQDALSPERLACSS